MTTSGRIRDSTFSDVSIGNSDQGGTGRRQFGAKSLHMETGTGRGFAPFCQHEPSDASVTSGAFQRRAEIVSDSQGSAEKIIGRMVLSCVIQSVSGGILREALRDPSVSPDWMILRVSSIVLRNVRSCSESRSDRSRTV